MQYASPSYEGGRSNSRIGLNLCAAVRAGFFSGFHGGGCLTIGGHAARWGFEVDILAMGGGTVPSVELGFHPSVMLRFGSENDTYVYNGFFLRLGPEFRFGFPKGVDGQIFQLGPEAGAGYEWQFAEHVTWRIADLRFYSAFRTDHKAPDDDLHGHRYDVGFLLMSGIGFN